MKSKIVKLLCLLCAICMFCACSSEVPPEEIGFKMEFTPYTSEGYDKIAESNGVSLMLNQETMDIMLQSGDFTWHSYVFTQKELKASSSDRDNHSLFLIDGAIIGGSQFQLDSYTDSINRDQYEITKIDNGFKVTFVAGKLERSRALPELMDKASLDAILDKVEEKESKRIRKKIELWYSLYTVEDADPEVLKKYEAITKYSAKYPEGMYALKTGIVDKEKDEIESYFIAAGLTVEQVEEYHESIEYESEALSRPIVQLDMEFVLDNGDLVVSLPADSILLDNTRYVLNSVKILESLCSIDKTGEKIPVPKSEAENVESSDETASDDASSEETTEGTENDAEKADDKEADNTEESKDASSETSSDTKEDEKKEDEEEMVLQPTGEDGRFFFYPDGSGVVTDLKAANNIVGEGILTGVVYNTVYDKIQGYASNPIYGNENISVPVFGFAKTNGAILGIVESGAEVTRITANYNSSIQSIYASFVFEKYDIAKVDEMVALSEYYTTGKSGFVYKVRYKLLTGTDIDYVDMAHSYRDYLIARGDITADGASDEMQFVLETLGYIKADEDVAFATVKKDKPLTTYEDNIELLQKLSDAGVDNINLRLNGWSNGGMNNYYNDSVDLSDEMGGEEGFKKLVDYVTDNKIKFFPNVNFMTVGNVKMFDGFSPTSTCARDKDNQYEGIYVYIPANSSFAGFNYILNSAFIPDVINEYFEDAADYWDCKTISTNYMSTVLAKSYRADKEVSATENLAGIIKAFELLSKDREVMVQGANSYAFKYADMILDVPSSCTENPSLEQVPFLQIVLHGSVDFTGAAVNTYSSYEDAILECIEYGTGLYFTMIKENLMYLKASEFSYYYSADDNYWIAKAIEAYKTVSAAVGDCVGQEITDHEKLADGVYVTTFANGKKTVVNYNLYDVELDGIGTVTAKGYYVG